MNNSIDSAAGTPGRHRDIVRFALGDQHPGVNEFIALQRDLGHAPRDWPYHATASASESVCGPTPEDVARTGPCRQRS